MYCGPASDASAESDAAGFLEKTSPAYGNCLEGSSKKEREGTEVPAVSR